MNTGYAKAVYMKAGQTEKISPVAVRGKKVLIAPLDKALNEAPDDAIFDLVTKIRRS